MSNKWPYNPPNTLKVSEYRDVRNAWLVIGLFCAQTIIIIVGLVALSFTDSTLANNIALIAGGLGFLFVGPTLTTCYNLESPEARDGRDKELRHYMARDILPRVYLIAGALVLASSHFFHDVNEIILIVFILLTFILLLLSFSVLAQKMPEDQKQIIEDLCKNRDLGIVSCSFSIFVSSIITSDASHKMGAIPNDALHQVASLGMLFAFIICFSATYFINYMRGLDGTEMTPLTEAKVFHV